MNKQDVIYITAISLLLPGVIFLYFYSQKPREVSEQHTLISKHIHLVDREQKVEKSAGLLQTEQKKRDLNIELDDEFLSGIKIGQTSADKWVIDLKDLSQDKIKDTEITLVSMLDKAETEFSPDSKLGLAITSPLGKVTVKKQGILIDRISSRLFSNIGIQEGDIIKCINTRKANTLSDIYHIYKSIRSDQNQRWLSLEVERNGTLICLEYRIR